MEYLGREGFKLMIYSFIFNRCLISVIKTSSVKGFIVKYLKDNDSSYKNDSMGL